MVESRLRVAEAVEPRKGGGVARQLQVGWLFAAVLHLTEQCHTSSVCRSPLPVAHQPVRRMVSLEHCICTAEACTVDVDLAHHSLTNKGWLLRALCNSANKFVPQGLVVAWDIASRYLNVLWQQHTHGVRQCALKLDHGPWAYRVCLWLATEPSYSSADAGSQDPYQGLPWA